MEDYLWKVTGDRLQYGNLCKFKYYLIGSLAPATFYWNTIKVNMWSVLLTNWIVVSTHTESMIDIDEYLCAIDFYISKTADAYSWYLECSHYEC